MAQKIPKVPFGSETQLFEGFGLFQRQVPDLFGRVGTKRICCGALQHLTDGKESDHNQKNIHYNQDYPAEGRDIQIPVRKVDISCHCTAGT